MKFQTDKYKNGLIPVYDDLLEPYKDAPVKLLEIGTYMGGSLQYYASKLPKGEIFGVDIESPSLELPDNVRFYIADQRVPSSFNRVIEHAPFDFIIDDGAHMLNETKTTYETLFPHLKSGGMYIIEDWGVGYWEQVEFSGMKDFVLDLLKSANLHYSSFSVKLTPERSICLLRKL